MDIHPIPYYFPTNSPTKNYVIIWNGTKPVWAAQGTTFTFSIDTFSDGISAVQEIGSGTWMAIGAITFTATYNNGPPDATPYIVKSSTGGTNTWLSNLNMTGAGYVGPTTNAEIVTHRTSVGTITFTLYAEVGTETSNSTQTVYFYNRIYKGISTTASGYTNGDVIGLGANELFNTTFTGSGSYKDEFNVNATGSNYIIFAAPTRLSASAVLYDADTGLGLDVQSPETVSVTNASSFTENFYVWRSTNKGLGNTNVGVK